MNALFPSLDDLRNSVTSVLQTNSNEFDNQTPPSLPNNNARETPPLLSTIEELNTPLPPRAQKGLNLYIKPAQETHRRQPKPKANHANIIELI
jgi:hypothetical protein